MLKWNKQSGRLIKWSYSTSICMSTHTHRQMLSQHIRGVCIYAQRVKTFPLGFTPSLHTSRYAPPQIRTLWGITSTHFSKLWNQHWHNTVIRFTDPTLFHQMCWQCLLLLLGQDLAYTYLVVMSPLSFPIWDNSSSFLVLHAVDSLNEDAYYYAGWRSTCLKLGTKCYRSNGTLFSVHQLGAHDSNMSRGQGGICQLSLLCHHCPLCIVVIFCGEKYTKLHQYSIPCLTSIYPS